MRPTRLDTLTIRPARRRRMAGRKAWVPARSPGTLVSKQVLAFSQGTISIGPQAEKPALLTRTSGPAPSVRSKARSAQAATELWSVTSRASGVIARGRQHAVAALGGVNRRGAPDAGARAGDQHGLGVWRDHVVFL